MNSAWLRLNALSKPSAPRLPLLLPILVVIACDSRTLPALSDAAITDSAVHDGVPFAGRWRGYIENYKLVSGSDAVAFYIPPDGSISVVFGFSAPASIDKDKGFPDDASMIHSFVLEGFPFSAKDISVTPERLVFTINRTEQWDTWCRLQTSYLVQDDIYFCLPNSGSGRDAQGCWINPGGVKQYLDCGKISLCQNPEICRCSAAGCIASSSYATTFDMHGVSVDKMSGSAQLAGTHNVYMNRETE